MPEPVTTRAARALIELAGAKGRLYVPGSMNIYGREMTWTEPRSRAPACAPPDGRSACRPDAMHSEAEANRRSTTAQLTGSSDRGSDDA